MMDMNGTTKFSPVVETGSDASSILAHVYRALQAKGYDPVTQLVGYLIATPMRTSPTSSAMIRLFIISYPAPADIRAQALP